jgi:hypothetical protein
MSLLQRIHTGRRHSPPRLLMYGTEGIGKSTTAAEAPNPIFIPTEDGLDQIDCASFPLAGKFADVESALQALLREQHDFETVVLDSADWLERLIWDVLCEQYGVSSIEKVDGGYAKGYTHALTYWRKTLNDLNALRNERGMCVILLAHAKVEKFEDPEHSAYDRYRLSPKIRVREADDPVKAPRDLVSDHRSSEHGPQSGPVDDDPANNARQQWAIQRMRTGADLRKTEILTQFGCSSKTAERDLRDLRRRGLIEFVGPAKTGHWRLVQEAVDAR